MDHKRVNEFIELCEKKKKITIDAETNPEEYELTMDALKNLSDSLFDDWVSCYISII